MKSEKKIIQKIKLKMFILISIFLFITMGIYISIIYFNMPNILSITILICIILYIIIMAATMMYTNYMLKNNSDIKKELIEKIKK